MPMTTSDTTPNKAAAARAVIVRRNAAIIAEAVSGRSTTDIADDYGVSSRLIRRILSDAGVVRTRSAKGANDAAEQAERAVRVRVAAAMAGERVTQREVLEAVRATGVEVSSALVQQVLSGARMVLSPKGDRIREVTARMTRCSVTDLFGPLLALGQTERGARSAHNPANTTNAGANDEPSHRGASTGVAHGAGD